MWNSCSDHQKGTFRCILFLFLCCLSIFLIIELNYKVVDSSRVSVYIESDGQNVESTTQQVIVPQITAHSDSSIKIIFDPLSIARVLSGLPPKPIVPKKMESELEIFQGTRHWKEPLMYSKENWWFSPEDEPIDFCVVVTLSIDRLFMIPHLLSRWPGYISLVIYTHSLHLSHTRTYIRSLRLPPRVTATLYISFPNSPDYLEYPINSLRNCGIRFCFASHVVMIDIDMVPSENLYHELHSIPHSLFTHHSLIILPSFFLSSDVVDPINCGSYRNCALESLMHIPTNKKEVKRGVQNGSLTMRRRDLKQHMYVTLQWFRNSNSPVSTVECILNELQEPYFIIRRDNRMPLFDETLNGFGGDKQEYFDRLRFMYDYFYILNNAFLVDIQHPRDVNPWNSSRKTRQSRAQYIQQLNNLRKVMGGREGARLKVCNGVKESNSNIVFDWMVDKVMGMN